MKPLDSSMFDKLKTKAFGKFSKGLGSMLIITSAMGWALGSTAQIFGILKNDKYSKKEKGFLVRQEVADATLNILSFCAITTGFKNLSKKLVDSGKLITPAMEKFCKKQNIDLAQPKTSISKIVNEKLDTVVKGIQTAKEAGNLGEVKALRSQRNALTAFNNRTFKPFVSGAEVAGTLAGGILASNVITPICRNKIAAASVKKQNEQQKPQYSYPISYSTRAGLKV